MSNLFTLGGIKILLWLWLRDASDLGGGRGMGGSFRHPGEKYDFSGLSLAKPLNIFPCSKPSSLL
jgi:hypothetical protein